MLTYNELVELRKKFANGDISLELAKELYWKDFEEGKKSWHTKDWKERRAEIVKDKCEICGSKEILTLQHLSHPKKYYEYEKEVTKKHTQTFINSNANVDINEFSEYVKTKYKYFPVPLCPNCESRNPNKRMRKKPKYLCTECRHEFDEPVYKSADELIATFYENEECPDVRDKCFVSKDKRKNRYNLSNVKYWLQRETVKIKEPEIIGKEAFLLYLDDNIKYLSFEDTITACRKCASNYDLHNMELCPKCKENYKGAQYATCIQCLPEEKRKEISENIEFLKEMQEMSKKLGID